MNFVGDRGTTRHHEPETAVHSRRNATGGERIANVPRSAAALWLCALFVLQALAACDSGAELRWKEDVKLEDGRVITVSRRSEFKGPYELGKSPGESHVWLEFDHPATKEKVRFETSLLHDSEAMVAAGARSPAEPGLLQYPRALMMSGDDLYVVTDLSGSIYRFLGCPDPSMFLYLWNRGRWERRPLEEIPYRSFSVNVTVDAKKMRTAIEQARYHLGTDWTYGQSISHRRGEFDLTGMTKQMFSLPPNCVTCITYEYVRPKQGSDFRAGPYCTQPGRNWYAHEKLTN